MACKCLNCRARNNTLEKETVGWIQRIVNEAVDERMKEAAETIELLAVRVKELEARTVKQANQMVISVQAGDGRPDMTAEWVKKFYAELDDPEV